MEPDHVYTSYLKRAIKTAWLALAAIGREYAPETRAWQLNERMYGLAGLTPQEAYAMCVGSLIIGGAGLSQVDRITIACVCFFNR